jgi:hypothetical protein
MERKAIWDFNANVYKTFYEKAIEDIGSDAGL